MESKIQKKIIDYLRRELNAYAIKPVVVNRAGVPDIIACVGGRFVAIEVKRPGASPSELQRYNLKKIWDAGGISIIAHSVEEARSALANISQKNTERIQNCHKLQRGKAEKTAAL